jgi:hypothetical protein
MYKHQYQRAWFTTTYCDFIIIPPTQNVTVVAHALQELHVLYVQSITAQWLSDV